MVGLPSIANQLANSQIVGADFSASGTDFIFFSLSSIIIPFFVKFALNVCGNLRHAFNYILEKVFRTLSRKLVIFISGAAIHSFIRVAISILDIQAGCGVLVRIRVTRPRLR